MSICGDRIRRAQQTDRHRQIERGRIFLQISGSKIDRQRMAGKRKAGIDHRPTDALDRFLHGRLRQTHNNCFRQTTLRDIDLDLAQQCVDPQQHKAMHFCEHV